MSTLPNEPRLIALSGVISGEVIPLAAADVTVGRDSENTVCIADAALSRHHCVLKNEGDAWVLRDLGSSNGTFVNSVPVSTHRLAGGDRISLGGSVLLFVLAHTQRAPDVDVIDADVQAITRTLSLEDAAYLKPPGSGPEGSRTEQGLRALLAISAVINAANTETELERELLSVIRRIVPATRTILLLSGEGEDFRAFEGLEGRAAPLHVSRSLVRRVLAERAGVLSQDITASSAFASERTSFGTVRSLLCVPIVLRDTPLGAYYIVSDTRAAFDDDHLQLVTAVARLAAVGIDRARLFTALEQEADRLRAHLHESHQLVGHSPPMERVFDLIRRVARTDTTVLVTGETGTGKELVARAIHMNGERARRPFVAVNCAALAESLIESELFGHERGAFTHALTQRKGRLELAHGGTLFLDEIGELSPALQSKLLRVLQEREFERVGGTHPIKVDIRLIAATNRNLAEEVRGGRFRQDLFFRLNVVAIDMPPLRHRQADIPELARHFLAKYAHKAGRRLTDIGPRGLESLQAYQWPGNVRELENVIERAVVLGRTSEILREDLPDDVVEARIGTPAEPIDGLHAAVIDTKKRVVLQALEAAHGNYTEAARSLGVHPNYLHRLAKNLGLKGDS